MNAWPSLNRKNFVESEILLNVVFFSCKELLWHVGGSYNMVSGSQGNCLDDSKV